MHGMTACMQCGTCVTPMHSSLACARGTCVTSMHSSLACARGTCVTPMHSSLACARGTCVTPMHSSLAWVTMQCGSLGVTFPARSADPCIVCTLCHSLAPCVPSVTLLHARYVPSLACAIRAAPCMRANPVCAPCVIAAARRRRQAGRKVWDRSHQGRAMQHG
jgi:hypothetical protein